MSNNKTIKSSYVGGYKLTFNEGRRQFPTILVWLESIGIYPLATYVCTDENPGYVKQRIDFTYKRDESFFIEILECSHVDYDPSFDSGKFFVSWWSPQNVDLLKTIKSFKGLNKSKIKYRLSKIKEEIAARKEILLGIDNLLPKYGIVLDELDELDLPEALYEVGDKVFIQDYKVDNGDGVPVLILAEIRDVIPRIVKEDSVVYQIFIKDYNCLEERVQEDIYFQVREDVWESH